MKPIHLDDLDRRIIARLGEDARTSMRQIARELDVSEGAVRTRVKRLHDAGAVRMAVITNAALHDRFPAFLWIDLASREATQDVVAALKAIPEITFVSTMLGRADVLAITLAGDSGDLARFIHEKVRNIPGIGEIRWTLGYGMRKHLYGKCAIVD
ncbi:Lrp/AsnC family transcriptional regulator [Caenibius sp. WL]|uniref:Lrp/AsnC family transcriptional regulator n=1 Tax=Caenibius sp. WL TaxID=2872646 RepID=UPI001C9A1046|nr:Lrp/AsnC family transcriptional regulator [Caenibius sp. WL]QZP08412.1 Lrp/AsnC family transcriptional regulator [Caenibius sp. WL]